MEVILTEDIHKLGNAGDLVRVKDGFARNYLLPRGKAMLATQGRVRDLEHKRRVIEEKTRKEVAKLKEDARGLAEIVLKFEVQANDEGKLFGSVTNQDIAGQLAERGHPVERRKIVLADPLKQLGVYDVPVRLHREVTTTIQVHVVGVGGPPPEAEEIEEIEESEESAEESEEARDSED